MALGQLLVTPFNPAFFAESSCLNDFFYGNYKARYSYNSIFVEPDVACLAAWEPTFATAHFAAIPKDGKQLVWIEEKLVDKSLKFDLVFEGNPLDNFFNLLQAHSKSHLSYQSQEVIANPEHSAYEVHYRTDDSALISVSPEVAQVVDTLVPSFWKSTILPHTKSTYRAVPTYASNRVKQILAQLRFIPEVASTVGNISVSQISNDIQFLTGEDGKSGIVSRHSFSTGALTAANWLKERVEHTGAKCRLMPFLTGFAPNVICRYEAVKDTNATVLISGHYDSRGSFGSTRAPGGDDDGSGTVGVLSIARTIARKSVKFHSNVELVFFSGEEQGLLGSRAYARELRRTDADIILMVQADMTAYRAAGEPLQLGLPDSIGSTDVRDLVAAISALYSPELRVGLTAACCSDHQSFHEEGFPATQVFERAGPIVDPMYHNSGDLSRREGYDFNQLFAIAKVQFATVLHAAGFEL